MTANSSTNGSGGGALAYPPPTRSLRELPDFERLRLLGIETLSLDEARVVLVALSLLIAKGRSRSRNKVNVMTSALVAACRVEMVRDGHVEPPALPDLPAEGWPQGVTAFRQLAIDREVLESYWVEARNRADDACLPLEWVLAFAPARLWTAVMALIRWGPLEAAMRVEEAMTVLARTPIRFGTRRRPDGSPLAAGTLETRVDGLWALMQVLIELRGKVQASRNPSLPLELLERWTFKPERIDLEACGAKEARLDTSGPPISDCARLIKHLHLEWQQAPKDRRYRRLRRLLLAAILTLYGPREGALRMLDVDDFIPDFVFRDGERGPALRFYPGKTRSHDDAHIVPLPNELGNWISEWITYTRRSTGQPDSPLFPSRPPKAGRPVKRISAGGLYCAIAGREGFNGAGNSLPLLPRADNPYEGYNPHAFRHTAYQAAKRAGVKAKQAHPYEFAHIDPEDFARAVVAHDLKRSIKDVYRDLNQQHLARAAIEHAWEDLWAEGKRQGLDPVTITREQDQVATLHAAITHLNRDVGDLYARQGALSQRTRTLTGDALHTALIESNQIAVEAQIANRNLTHLTDQLADAKRRLEDALVTHVPLPDDLSDEEHARLLAEALCNEDYAGQECVALPDHLTSKDIANISGTSEQTSTGGTGTRAAVRRHGTRAPR